MPKKLYRTDQVGSLVRPTKLLDARDAFKAGGTPKKNCRWRKMRRHRN